MSKKAAYRRLEAKIFQGLHRQHPDAPDDVIGAEARIRMLARALLMRESGSTQAAVAQAIGYSLHHTITHLIPQAQRRRIENSPSPLTVWLAHHPIIEPMPEPEEAFIPAADAASE